VRQVCGEVQDQACEALRDKNNKWWDVRRYQEVVDHFRGRIQFVQHHTPEAIWRPEYLGHGNGVVKLACVFVVADDPVAAGARWAHFAALLPRPAGAFVHLPSARGDVLIGERRDWDALLGDAPAAPALAGYALECRDPSVLVSRCKLLGLALRKLRENLYAVSLPGTLGGSWLFGTQQGLGLPS